MSSHKIDLGGIDAFQYFPLDRKPDHLSTCRYYRGGLYDSGYFWLVHNYRKTDIQSAELDFCAGVDFSLFIDGSDFVYSLAEFAESRSEDSAGVFRYSAGFECSLVRDFFRARIADGGIPGDYHPLDFYPDDHDNIFKGIQGNRLFAVAVHLVG